MNLGDLAKVVKLNIVSIASLTRFIAHLMDMASKKKKKRGEDDEDEDDEKRKSLKKKSIYERENIFRKPYEKD